MTVLFVDRAQCFDARAGYPRTYLPHDTLWRARTSRTFSTRSSSFTVNWAGRVSRHSWFEAIAAAAFGRSLI
jgi:hypothetical protein